MHSTDRTPSKLDIPKQPDMVAIFTVIGASMTGLMSIVSFLFNKDIELSLVLLSACLLYLVILYLYRVLNKKKIVSSLVIYSLHILMYYLVFTGGVESTGILWLFIIAPVTVYIHGLRRGAIETGLFLGIVAILMNLPESYGAQHYTTSFKIRFFLSFLTVSIISSLYEFSRQNWYKHTLALTEKYQKLALYDQLTELSNRRHALKLMEQEQSRLDRGGEKISIFLCDVDHFKIINDHYGHCAGDLVLTELANLFKSSIRNQDTAARWGGEEFLFILPQTNIEKATQTAEKIRALVEEFDFYFNSDKIKLTISIGVEELTSECSLDDCINSADKKLYKAKNQGRNQVCS